VSNFLRQRQLRARLTRKVVAKVVQHPTPAEVAENERLKSLATVPLARHDGCQATTDDGDCRWKDCPQLRDCEPYATGRWCPRIKDEEEA
jgi:hypothetical protein